MKYELEDKLKNDRVGDLANAFVVLSDEKQVIAFLRDVLSLEELAEMANRFRAAKLLEQGKTIREIAGELKMSTTTVVRIKYWLHHGMGGYDLALEKLKV